MSFAVNLNIGLRHLLPIYPFTFVLLGSLVKIKFRNKEKTILLKTILIVLIVWYILEAAFIIPHNLSYFNEFVGVENGWKYLADVDVDWGGYEAKQLGKYLNERNYTSEIRFSSGELPLWYKDYFKNQVHIPVGCGPENGYYLITTSTITVYEGRECRQWLLKYEPIDKIGYSMFIYNITDVGEA
jgi:hypothetical protein